MTAPRWSGCFLAAALWTLPGAFAQAPDPARLDAAFQKFWAASSPAEAAERIGEIEKTGIGFDDALRRLKAGRTYEAQPAGVVHLKNKIEGGIEHYFAVTVPPGYDPARRYAAHNRAHWLILDRFGVAPREAKTLTEVKEVVSGSDLDGLQRGPIFGRSRAAGRVDLVRMGNTVRAATSGVAAFTLLLSADKFDFSQPIRVVANGREVFHAKVDRSLATLLKWAAQDNDRTMLYAADLPVKLGK